MKKKKIIFPLAYGVAFLTLLSLFLLAKATEGSENFEQLYQVLLITIIVGISCLFVIVIIYLFYAFIHYRRKIPGATLSITILWRTLLLAIIPLLLIAFFAFKFLRYEFQSSFDQGINEALTNSLILSQKALNIRALQALKESRNVAKTIAPYEYIILQTQLERVRQSIGASELTVFDEKGFIQAFASVNPELIIPPIPEHSDFIRAENQGGIFAIESNNGQFAIRVLTDINKPGAPNYYLQALFFVPDTISKLTEQVNRTVTERDKFNYLMPRVNQSFIFVMILVLLLAILLLILSSIGFANAMVQPIRELIRGTKSVSQGDFNHSLVIKRYDDFGTLMQSFNRMTHSLKTATEEAESNRHKVESERAYLATVINHMTAGVLTLDYRRRLLTFNASAKQLLDCPLAEAVLVNINKLSANVKIYQEFIQQVSFIEGVSGNEKEIKINQADISKHFIIRLTSLPSTNELHGGYVIIFDEFGHYFQRQKQAAWEEVARRLAHEIKNPLTPILLAAERLNYKLSGHLADKEQQLLTRSIKVISNQVKSLKNMVDDFSNFAKPITMKAKPLEITGLLKEVFDLYKDHDSKIEFSLQMTEDKVFIKGSEQLLRQVFHNLIKNAIEACENQSFGKIVIVLSQQNDKLHISITDNGVGLLSDSNDNNVFEPYVTTKEKGTGLGLAIVQKIIHEHYGTISLHNCRHHHGVTAEIILPLTDIPVISTSNENNHEPSTI